ncbi:hypothetical protein EWM64_g387 [Hericium alpestre]|uniref:AB hydrolase-1 domain-containing protein n=1 Tax=Hericium alpestre TaxID=135208 RepID=A0A4Z0AAQ4_9AGAM|nr:hypothetical protein EWM64_g387 [Hericium alpestre]
MGNNESVFLANASGQDVYVMAGLYPDWPVAEFLNDISRLYVGVEELKGATVEVLQLPEALITVRDLYEFLQVASKLLSGRIEIGSRSEEAAAILRDAFKENSILIFAGNDANLKDEELLRRYLNSNGVEGSGHGGGARDEWRREAGRSVQFWPQPLLDRRRAAEDSAIPGWIELGPGSRCWYGEMAFPAVQYAAAIKAFLASDALSLAERQNLVGVGHSGGGGSLIQALPKDGENIPLRTLILVESPHCDESSWPYFRQLYKVVKRSNARRPTIWNTVDDAVKWMRTHIPWKNFHPDIFEIIPQIYFRNVEGQPGKVTTKTTVEQETACFVDDGTHLGALTQLRNMLDRLPTHLIIGSEKDIWCAALHMESIPGEDNHRTGQTGSTRSSIGTLRWIVLAWGPSRRFKAQVIM